MIKTLEANRRMKYRLVSHFLIEEYGGDISQAQQMRDWSWNHIIYYILNNTKRNRQTKLVWNLEQNGICENSEENDEVGMIL